MALFPDRLGGIYSVLFSGFNLRREQQMVYTDFWRKIGSSMKSSTFHRHISRLGLGAMVAIFSLIANPVAWAEMEYTVRFDAMTSRGSNPFTDSLRGEMIIIAYDSAAKRIQTFISEPLKIPARSVGFGPDLITPDNHLHPICCRRTLKRALTTGP